MPHKAAVNDKVMMNIRLFEISGLLSLAMQVLATPAATKTTETTAPAFTYDATSFLLHGEPYIIIGGQMDPQRIPPEYWRDRLAKARAMGLNTIFSYVYWNLLEPQRGRWRGSEGANDISRYFELAQEEGLHVVLRPGPYICGEREWGGFPAWLSSVPGLVVRSFNEPFLNLSQGYLEHLAADLGHLQVTKGGPILMVQVENEYGSYGSDHSYTQAIRHILQANFDVTLYTSVNKEDLQWHDTFTNRKAFFSNDGGVEWTLAGGSVPGILAETDGDPRSGFAARDEYITDPTMLGPLLDGEYYTYAPDTWGFNNSHNTVEGNPSQVAQFVSDLDFVLAANNSISLYVRPGLHRNASFVGC